MYNIHTASKISWVHYIQLTTIIAQRHQGVGHLTKQCDICSMYVYIYMYNLFTTCYTVMHYLPVIEEKLPGGSEKINIFWDLPCTVNII